FSGAVNTLAERSTHSIFAEDGTIADLAYIDLLKRKLPYPLAPVIDRGVLLSIKNATGGTGSDSQYFAHLIGIDVLFARSLRSFTKMQSTLDDAAFRTFLTEPNQVVLVDALARRLGVVPGAILRIASGAHRSDVHVIGVVQPTGVARSQINDIVIADLATAQ